MNIVTFNVYWFQGSHFKGFPPPPPKREMIAAANALLTGLPCEILCLQELQSRDVAQAWAAAWQARERHYQSGQCQGREAYGGGIFCRSDGWQFNAVESKTIDRFAAQTIRESDGLCIANVHLRSDRFLAADAAAAMRREELLAVFDTGPRPDIIAGDFNARMDEDLWELLRDRDYFDVADRMGFRDAATTLGTGQGDRIWIHQRLAGKFVTAGLVGRQKTLLSGEEPVSERVNEHISDHLPVWADLNL